MACEKYTGWMTDASLGELRPEREGELLAHAVGCAACREALDYTRAAYDFVDGRVAALVAGEPSPEFATRVRRRIAQESEPRRLPWPAWTTVVAGALALAVVLAIMVAHLRVHSEINPSVASAVTPVPAPSEAAMASPASPQHAQRTQGKLGPERTRRARPFTTALPEIIVPQGQFAAVVQLSAAIRSGRVDGYQLVAAQREFEKPLDVKPIEIAPLEIPALDTATEKPANSTQF